MHTTWYNIGYTNNNNNNNNTNLMSGTTRLSWYQKSKTNLDLLQQEKVSDGNGISWAIWQICTLSQTDNIPVPHHSVLYRLDALPAAQPTVSKH